MRSKNKIHFVGFFAIMFLYFLVTGNETKTSHTCGKLTEYDKILLDSLLSFPAVSEQEKQTLGVNDLAVVTSASLNHIAEAIRSCDSFQQHPQLKNVPFLMYMHDDVPNEVRSIYAELCPNAKIFSLNLKKYPDYVEDLTQKRFKYIYQALALQNYKVVLNIDSSVRFVKNANFEELIKLAIKRNPTDVTLLSHTNHNVFASTHPLMFKCFPNIHPKKTVDLIEYQSGLILWLSTKSGWKIMKNLLQCSLQKDCMAPFEAVSNCNLTDLFGHPNSFSGCHRFDQSAINLILYEAAGYNSFPYQLKYSGLYVDRNVNM